MYIEKGKINPKSGQERPLLKEGRLPRLGGGQPGIFWLSFIFSLKRSAIDLSATAPPPSCLFDTVLIFQVNF